MLFLWDPQINWSTGLGVSLFDSGGDMSMLASGAELGYERRVQLQVGGTLTASSHRLR